MGIYIPINLYNKFYIYTYLYNFVLFAICYYNTIKKKPN